MKLTARQGDLLLAAIQEYIKTGNPVASEDLRAGYRLPYSPATIRNELLLLSESGFLTQPHTSAGRVPTDEGYRWYAEQIRARRSRLERQEIKRVHELSNRRSDPAEFFRSLSETFAAIAEALVVAGDVLDEPEPLHKSGFREILALPEFTDSDLRGRFGELIDSIDRDMRELLDHSDFQDSKVFIGRDVPIAEAEDCSMMVRTFGDGKRLSGVIAIIGPKRMRYDKGFSLLSAAEQFFQ